MVDVAIMRDKHTGRSRGFAFVTFETQGPDALKKLKSLLLESIEPHAIQGRKVEIREGDGIKPADSFLARTQSVSQPETD